MASPTTEHSNHVQQAPTRGMGMTAPKAGTEAERPAPVLLEDIDPVLLIRLYPDAESTKAARAQAEAAGIATHAAGATLTASQQEPVLVEGAAPAPPPAPPHARS
jgi:hypothetical protein